MILKLFLTIASLLLTFNIWAVNGLQLIGQSVRSRAMGGTGVAAYLSSMDTLVKNPALLSKLHANSKQKDVSFVFHTILLDVEGKSTGSTFPAAGTGTQLDSEAKTSFAPSVALGWTFNEKFSFGTGLVALSGLEVDYKGDAEVIQIHPELAIMRIPFAFSYAFNSTFSFGIEPYINITQAALNESSTGTLSDRDLRYSLGAGLQLGTHYSPSENFSLGLSYTTESQTRTKQFADIDAFGPTGANGLDNVMSQTPAEFALGLSFKPLTSLLLNLDIRHIMWKDAKFWGELGWKNQTVVALGAEYRPGKWAYRFGYNYAASPLESTTGIDGTAVIDFQGHRLYQASQDFFNAFATPVTAEHHLTLGLGFDWNQQLQFGLALVHAFKNGFRKTGSSPAGGSYDYSFDAGLTAISLGGEYAF